ncbi:hypothetical protein ACLOJK_016954 [Asimina triloba]
MSKTVAPKRDLAIPVGGGHEQREDTKTGSSRKVNDEDLEKWLPITASRGAKWYYSAFHNVCAMVGAGVLGLPLAMAQLGWIPGILALCISWVVTLYTLWQMVELHEDVPGKRFDRYHELGQHSFGQRLGFWIVFPQQAVVQVASDIVYMVTGGKSLKKFFDIVSPEVSSIRKTYFILVFACVQLILSQCPNFNSLTVISLLAAVMSMSYSMISFITCLVKGRHPGSHYGVRASKPVDITFDVFSALGTIAFAYAGHSVVLEIQATMPTSEQKPSKIPMWRGVLVAYVVVAVCYFSVALTGYWAFGNLVEDDVLISLERPPWLIAAANLMVFAMPIFDMIESALVKNLNFRPGLRLRLIARTIYVGEHFSLI